MKKLISLLALAGLVGGAQAATQTVSVETFQYSYDDTLMTYSEGSAYTSNFLTTFMVWDNATNQSYAANFNVFYSGISFDSNDTLLANSSDTTVTGTYAADVTVANTNGLKIQQADYNGPTEGFIEFGTGSVVSSISGAGFTGQVDANSRPSYNSSRNESLNIPGFARAGSFNTYGSISTNCSGMNGCTVADYENGLGTDSLNFSGVQTVTASSFREGSSAGYQRSNGYFLYADAYEFVGYANTAPVPEPETYAMLLAGLGLVGAIARRRRASTAA